MEISSVLLSEIALDSKKSFSRKLVDVQRGFLGEDGRRTTSFDDPTVSFPSWKFPSSPAGVHEMRVSRNRM